MTRINQNACTLDKLLRILKSGLDHLGGSAILLLMLAGTTLASEYPTKPIRMIVGFTAGGGADAISRLVGNALSERLKQPIVIDHRPGAGGMVGSLIVANAAPDGYSLLLTNSNFATNPALYEKTVRYDVAKDFAPIYRLGTSQYLLVVIPSVPVNSVQELIAYAKARPKTLNVASAGIGGPGHLAAELFMFLTGTQLGHIPYKGSASVMTSLLSAETQMNFGNMGAAIPLARAGKLRGLAVSGIVRSSMAKEFPTVAEAGIPGFNVSSWYGVLAPSGTVKAIVNRLHQELAQILALRDLHEKLAVAGMEVWGAPPEAFAAFIDAEVIKWKKVAKAADIRLE